jgi:hypothetical protein
VKLQCAVVDTRGSRLPMSPSTRGGRVVLVLREDGQGETSVCGRVTPGVIQRTLLIVFFKFRRAVVGQSNYWHQYDRWGLNQYDRWGFKYNSTVHPLQNPRAPYDGPVNVWNLRSKIWYDANDRCVRKFVHASLLFGSSYLPKGKK